MLLVKDKKTERPPLPPIVGIRIKKTTAEVVRGSVPAQGGGVRSEITEISKRSVKNAIEILTNADPELNSMVVLTYPDTYPEDGRVVKEHHRRMLHAIGRRFGDFDYFTAVEYQKRGAPHLHIGLSIDLADHGDVIDVQRREFSRRVPVFQTVKTWSDWCFRTWQEIINEPEPIRHGVKLDWQGLPQADIEAMNTAYFEYNAGVSWEVMRSDDGAKKYFVKELTGLKSYQKAIPEGFEHPGRHFLYSRGMKFDPENAIEFAVTDSEIRAFLEEAGWQYLPDDNKPLYKHLWNAAEILAIKLIEAGIEPIKGTLAKLREFSDLRMFEFADKSGAMWRKAVEFADLGQAWASVTHWERIKRRLIYQQEWEWTFDNGPPA